MSDPGEFSLSELRDKRAQNQPARPPEAPAFGARETAFPPARPARTDDDSEDEEGFKLQVDWWRVAAAIKRHAVSGVSVAPLAPAPAPHGARPPCARPPIS